MSNNCYITLKQSVNLDHLSEKLGVNLNNSCNDVYHTINEDGFAIAPGQNVVVPCTLTSDQLQHYAFPTKDGSYIRHISSKYCPGNMGEDTSVDNQYMVNSVSTTTAATAATAATNQVLNSMTNVENPCREFLREFLRLFGLNAYTNVSVVVGNYTLKNNMSVIVVISETISAIIELQYNMKTRYGIEPLFNATGVVLYSLDQIVSRLPKTVTDYLSQCKARNKYISL